jgi:putative copper export protein
VLEFFQGIESLPIGMAARESAWFVAAINVVHLLSLVMFTGALLVVDLRLLGTGMRRVPLAQLARDARPWLIAGFLGLLTTGLLQVLTTPIKQYYSPHFWWKMETLIIALLFTFVIRWRLTQRDESRVNPILGKLVAVVSITIWTSIAVFGRLIGLLS